MVIDSQKKDLISSHAYTDILYKIPFRDNFSNKNNIFNWPNKPQVLNSLNNHEYNNI